MEIKNKTILKPGGTAGITLDKPDTRVLSVSTILGKLQVLDSGSAEGETHCYGLVCFPMDRPVGEHS